VPLAGEAIKLENGHVMGGSDRGEPKGKKKGEEKSLKGKNLHPQQSTKLRGRQVLFHQLPYIGKTADQNERGPLKKKHRGIEKSGWKKKNLGLLLHAISIVFAHDDRGNKWQGGASKTLRSKEQQELEGELQSVWWSLGLPRRPESCGISGKTTLSPGKKNQKGKKNKWGRGSIGRGTRKAGTVAW